MAGKDDKRTIPGEPEDYDGFENSWYDDPEPPADEMVEDNGGKAKFFPFTEAHALARKIAEAKSLDEAEAILVAQEKVFVQRGASEKKAGWTGGCRECIRSVRAMRDDSIRPTRGKAGHKKAVRYAQPVFVAGNMKLPFWTWSKLPVYTCPGRGRCAAFCYSVKHFGHASAYFTWAQNTLLAHFRFDIIEEAFRLLPEASVLRLHVDGDFESHTEIAHWMRILGTRPAAFDGNAQVSGISSYSYSKSWQEFLEYDDVVGLWPKHFWINISSDGKWHNDPSMKRRIMALPCVRGEFVVVEDPDMPQRKIGVSMTGDEKDALSDARYAVVAADMEAKYQGKQPWFVCRGKCAVCVDHGNDVFRHACGHEKYKGVIIGIGKH